MVLPIRPLRCWRASGPAPCRLAGVPLRPGPCIRCGRSTVCYWRPDNGDSWGDAWPLCPDCQLVAHEQPEVRAALADLLPVLGAKQDESVN